jgi:hypothetical protein
MEAQFCMGAKAGSRDGLQQFSTFASTWFATIICLQADQQGLQGLQT